ncbi:MAG: aldehyde dehydrogenase [Epsilonproteobacteria bacterium]|nr:MAG: aldehyde dehydrogenase [Gammaproteobacteria bacterium]RLA60871.1 MAG: aldehyde dehydrogenase [Campylobacterota bacterium]
MAITDLPSGISKGLLIDGQWVDASGGTFDVFSPHSGEVLHSIGKCTPADAERAIASSKTAFSGWKNTPVSVRAGILRRMTELMAERGKGEALAQMVCAEIGKPIMDAREEILEYAAPSWRKAAEEVVRHRGETFPSTQEARTSKRIVQFFRPLGVVAVITPYNFPVDIACIALAHCAAAGNTIVWKPSEYAAAACAMTADLFEEAGFPPGVINVVQGVGDVGATLVASDDIKGIFFTGSTPTGIRIAREAVLKPQLLELGGDGPFIILPDADIDAAVEGAINGCFYYAGQVCTSAERLLVHADIHDEFVDKFIAKAKMLKVGNPADEDTDMGPVCNMVTRDRCVRHVEDAVAKGAQITQVGPSEGLYFPATILTGVTMEMEIIQEETFGPVAPIVKINSVQEAIEIANSTDLGLICSLWTKDLATAWRVAEAVPHGTVNINETSNYWDQLAPFGGTGSSGVGRELSKWFMDTFTESKLMVFDLGDEGRQEGRAKAEGGW